MNSYNLIRNDRGSALVVVMALLMMTGLVAVTMFSISDDDVTITINTKDATKAFYAAESGLALARTKLWSDYENWNSTNPMKVAGEIGNRVTYQKYLDNIGLADSTQINLIIATDLGDLQSVDSVTAFRDELPSSTMLYLASYGTAGDGASQVIRSVLRVEGSSFQGFEFALLSNNVNCIMCHATFDNVERAYNTDPSKVGTFDRIKVASLETMKIRDNSADSKIAGTLYTRGIVMNKSGSIITDLGSLDGFAIDPTTGKILEPMTMVDLVNTTGSPLPQNGNLYIDYPDTPADMTDGNLPSTFPPPFPDDNNNKLVDDAEFAQVATAATGSINGGIIYGVATGGSYTAGTLPSASNETSISKSYDGNLILVGTAANPIEINGDVYIDGDVIIQGPIKGTGQIFSRGNTYVTGDMTYADGVVGGNRTYGIASDNTKNTVSIAAGGNILVGDYLTPKKGDIADLTSIDPGNLTGGEKFSFAMSEVTLFNQREWSKTQPMLPGSGGGLVVNSTYDPTYQPRYYTMNDGDPVYIFNKLDTWWDPATNTWQGKEHTSSYDMTVLTKLDPGDPQLVGATITSLSSNQNWISPTTLKKLWIEDETARTAGSEFKIDGQLYTNNSIFALTRSASKTGGRMTVNGSMVASDLGVLVPTGLILNYDQRLKEFLKLKDESKIVMILDSWYAEK